MGLAIGLLLGAILLFWLGTRQRKKVYAEYEDDSQKYTATTTMTLIKQTKSETQRWEDKGDGNQELVTDICYLPTYEYTVNGEVYHYTSRHGSDTVQKPGMQRTGYYEPSNPKKYHRISAAKTGTWGCPLFYPGSGITDFRSCCASEFVMVMIFTPFRILCLLV